MSATCGRGSYWSDRSQQNVEAVVRRSVELGINYFDTAKVYDDGCSEESLGRAGDHLLPDRGAKRGKIRGQSAGSGPAAARRDRREAQLVTGPVLDTPGNGFDYYEDLGNDRTR